MKNTMEHDNNTSMRDSIVGRLREKAVFMRPRWYFVVRSVVVVMVTIGIVAVIVFLISFIHFWMNSRGVLLAPSIGLRGVWLLLAVTPWILVGLVVTGFAGLEWLLRRYANAYRMPIIITAVGIVVVGVGAGIALNQTNIHNHIEQFAEKHETPGLRPLYRGGVAPGIESIYVGTIEDVIVVDKEFILTSRERAVVRMVSGARVQPGAIQVGKRVVVFGDQRENIIEAFGVRSVNEESNIMGPFRQRPMMRIQPENL